MSDATALLHAQTILRQLRDAVAANKDTDKLEDDFQAAREKIKDKDERKRLSTAWQKVIQADAGEAFKAYADAVAEMKPLAESFELGTRMAADGQRGLFVPAAAAYLEQVAGILEELKTTADNLVDNVDEIRDGVADAKDAFRKGDIMPLIDTGEAIVMLWAGNPAAGEEGLRKKLEAIRDKLTD